MNRSSLIDSNAFQNLLVWNFSGGRYTAPNICCSVPVVTTLGGLILRQHQYAAVGTFQRVFKVLIFSLGFTCLFISPSQASCTLQSLVLTIKKKMDCLSEVKVSNRVSKNIPKIRFFGCDLIN